MAWPSDYAGSPAGNDFSLIGAQDSAGDERGLFLKVWSGEVLEVFQKMTVMLERVMFRDLTTGKNAQFPAVGSASVGYHSRGQNIFDPTNGLLAQVDFGERVIDVDRPLLALELVDELQEIINHYEVRAPLTRALARAHAEIVDKHLQRLLIVAATEVDANQPNQDFPSNANHVITAATLSASELIKSFRTAAQRFDEADVPKDNRWVIVAPQTYYTLIDAAEGFTHRDVTANINGGLDVGEVNSAFGFTILNSNVLPVDNSTATGTNEDTTGQVGETYVVDATNTLAVCFHPMCLGSVRSMPITVDIEWRSEYQAWAIIAKQAIGHGILRPEAAIQIKSA